MNVIIPAAGCGKRMNGLGPKSLIEIGTESLISRQIRLIQGFVDTDITLVLGNRADDIVSSLPKNSGVKIVYNELNEITNVARSIYLGMMANPRKDTLIVYGDLVFNYDLVQQLRHNSRTKSYLMLDNGKSRKSEVGCTLHEDGTVLHLEYGLKTKWSHIAYLTAKDRDLFVNIAGKEESKKLFGYEVFNKMLDQTEIDGRVLALEAKLVEIDKPQDIATAKRVFK